MVILRGHSILYRFLTVVKIIDKSYLYYEPSVLIPAKSVDYACYSNLKKIKFCSSEYFQMLVIILNRNILTKL